MGKKTIKDSEIEQLVLITLSEVIDLEIKDKNLDFSKLPLDSLKKLELLAVLEKKFDIVLTEDLVREFVSIRQISQVVKETILSVKEPLSTQR